MSILATTGTVFSWVTILNLIRAVARGRSRQRGDVAWLRRSVLIRDAATPGYGWLILVGLVAGLAADLLREGHVTQWAVRPWQPAD
jgi:hypothetical protein